jgi:hypothetical protein
MTLPTVGTWASDRATETWLKATPAQATDVMRAFFHFDRTIARPLLISAAWRQNISYPKVHLIWIYRLRRACA